MATLYLISTPIGNLADVTFRAVEVLGSVSTVLAEDTRRSRVLLDHLEVETPLRSLHAHNEEARVREVLDALSQERDLALVSDAGTPLVSDPGARVVRAVAEAGHRVVPVPGPSAVLAALAASGMAADRFTFLGFVPKKGRQRGKLLDRIATAPETVVLFESPERIVGLLEDLEAACGPERRVSVGREITKVHEEFVRGTIPRARLYYEEHPPRGEITVVIEAAPEPGEPDEVDEAAARALAEALLEEGLRPSGVAREVARRLDLPRNLAYRIVHSLPR